jgi:hypothetical protein
MAPSITCLAADFISAAVDAVTPAIAVTTVVTERVMTSWRIVMDYS